MPPEMSVPPVWVTVAPAPLAWMALVAAVSLPCRYIHSSSCVAARADMESMLKLVACIDENADELIG